MGLKAKFNIVMGIVLLVGLGLAAVLSQRVLHDNAEREVMREAALITAHASAIRGYTVSEIEPLLREQMKVRFLPHTVPSWAAQTNFRTVQSAFPDYSYKEAALNPTNPSDRATDWEADIIQLFRRDSELKEFVTTRQTPTGTAIVVSRPIRITDAACLSCHTIAAQAPAAMVDLYGPANGFGWKLNEVIGAQIISVPTAVADQRANRLLVIYLSGLAGIFAVMMVLMNLMLHYVIVRPVRRISAAARDVSMGNMEAPEVEVKGRDEIASLSESFNRMRRSLANAMKMIGS
jgi:HAMP domain-containing protein